MKRNPIADESSIYEDSIRITEHVFKKPFSRFGNFEHEFLEKLFRRASNNRISLKIYPAYANSNPSALVKTKEDEVKWRRAIRSAERKFKKKKKNFTDRQWSYVVGAFKKMKHI